MPRRKEADPLAKAIGERIRQLREEQGLTAEKLAYGSDVNSKGYLSDIEAGLASPSIATLSKISSHLNVDLLDLFTFPESQPRHALIDRLRKASKVDMKRLTSALAAPKK